MLCLPVNHDISRLQDGIRKEAQLEFRLGLLVQGIRLEGQTELRLPTRPDQDGQDRSVLV